MKKNVCKTGFVLGIIAIFFGASVIPSTIGVNEQKITFRNSNSGGYIQGLIDNASAGDSIYIPAGIYYENIIIDKSISLIGEDKNTTIIDGGGNGDVIKVSADWVNINGFTLQNGNKGILIRHLGDHNTVSDNYIIDNYEGIYIDGEGDYNTISDNYIIANHVGINIRSIIGIWVLLGHHNTVSDNHIIDNYDGIKILGYYNTVSDNHINFNNGTGILIATYYDSWYQYTFASHYNIIEGNNISYNKHGICLSEKTGDTSIIGNNISNNGDGILVKDSRSNLILRNNLIGMEGNYTTLFFNVYDIKSNPVFGRNIWRQNYWDKSQSSPIVIHGEMTRFLDVWSLGYPPLFTIPWLEFDWFPAKEPYDIKVGI